MSNLYDIVKKTINSKSKIEAEQILFGQDGIVLNTKEYYQNIISNFKKKKESLIRKEVNSNNEEVLVFDLNNCNEIWDILFIYNYYERYMKEKINEFTKGYRRQIEELSNEIELLRQKKTSIQESISRTDKEKEKTELKNSLIYTGKKIRELNDQKKNLFEFIKNYEQKLPFKKNVKFTNDVNVDKEKISDELEKLKQAIVCIHNFRNSFAHNTEGRVQIDDDNFVINNFKDGFKLSIPIKYIDGFNKGRIIVSEEDQEIVEKTNAMAAPILEALDYDVKKVESFFYNVDPCYLNYLLEKVNYDYNKLYSLSYNVFTYPESTKKLINYGLDIFYISKLPDFAFIDYDETVKLIEEKIDVTQLPYSAFEYCDNTLKLKEAGIDITKLPNSAFIRCDNTLKLKEAGIDITKLPNSAFIRCDNTLKLKEAQIDVTKLPNAAFVYYNRTLKLIEAQIDVTKLKELKDVAFVYYDNTIKLIEAQIDVTELPEVAFKYCDNTIKLIEAQIDVTKLADYAFIRCDNTLKLIEEQIDVTQLPNSAFIRCDNTLKLIEEQIDVTQLPDFAFKYCDNTIKLIEAQIDVTKLPNAAFVYYDNTLKLKEAQIDVTKLPDKINKIYENYMNIRNLKFLLEKVNYNYEQLDTFPIEFFTCDINLLDEMLKNYNLNVAKSILGLDNPKLIATVLYANKVLASYDKKNVDTSIVGADSLGLIAQFIDNYDSYRTFINNQANLSLEDIKHQLRLNEFDRTQNFIRCLRNAFEHFRVKPARDNDGNILEDKIYIYDEENTGENNFNMVVDIKVLIELLKKLEDQIIKINVDSQENIDDNEIIQSDSKTHSGIKAA